MQDCQEYMEDFTYKDLKDRIIINEGCEDAYILFIVQCDPESQFIIVTNPFLFISGSSRNQTPLHVCCS